MTFSGEHHEERPRILIVEDEGLIASDIRDRLLELKYDVCGIESAGEGVEAAVAACKPDLVLMDINLRGSVDGIEASRNLQTHHDVPVVYLTAYAEDETIERARKTAPYGYILKPVQDRDLDITLRVALAKYHADKEVKRSRRYLDALVKAIPDGLIATDRNGLVEFMNPAAEVLTEFPGTEARELPVDEVAMTGSSPDETARVLSDCVLSGRNGLATPVNIAVSAFREDSGKHSGFIHLIRDMTERVRYEQELRDARAAAEAASRAKSEFFAMMTHEFRTPMNGILGLLDLLQGTDLDERQRMFSTELQGCAEYLLKLLNDLLALATIDAERVEIVSEPFDPALELRSAVQPYLLRAGRKGLDFRQEMGTLPERVKGDALRWRQIVSNLLDNALKFTDAGSVVFRAAAVSHDGNMTTLRIEVEDSGVGIPPDKLELVFDRFYQADSSMVRRYGGAGLGLAVCRELASIMGGTIDAESRMGEGSLFRVDIPFRMVCDRM